MNNIYEFLSHSLIDESVPDIYTLLHVKLHTTQQSTNGEKVFLYSWSFVYTCFTQMNQMNQVAVVVLGKRNVSEA